MCRLQFTQPATEACFEEKACYDGDEAVEALLALASDATGLVESQTAPLTDVEPITEFSASASQQAASQRYHCPFPGCKRSFAELWRLKVHYRAPPNIRGSGKERGHGMRLTHCPKCGAALKVGGHHVKCAAVNKEAGAGSISRRSRKAAAGTAASGLKPASPPAPAAAANSTEQLTAQLPGSSVDATNTTLDSAAAGKECTYTAGNGYSDMLQHTPGRGQSLWHMALQLHRQQMQQQKLRASQGHDAACKPEGVTAQDSTAPAAAVGPVCLWRHPSSDDSCNSRQGEGSNGSSTVASSGTGSDTNWCDPSSSAGSGPGLDHPEHHVSLAPSQAAQQPQLVDDHLQPLPQSQHQHSSAEQLIWQHMLLQHLQQHVQHAPGFSLPELIQVAAALFGSKVDTLVSAFGLSSSSTPAQADLSQLVSALGTNNFPKLMAAAAPAGGPHSQINE